MQLIAGLGNPGSQYEHNRHNVGFMAVDEIHRHHSFAPWRKKFQALVSDGVINGAKVLLMKPMTYMNESGRAIREASNFYKLAPEQVLVIYDEMDLPPGKIRMKQGGGHGGHNGPRSVHAHVGADYRRMRVGVGHPGDKNRVTNWVLSDFAKADAAWLDPLLDAISENAEFLAKGEDAKFASKVHLKLAPAPKPKKKPSEKPVTGSGDKSDNENPIATQKTSGQGPEVNTSQASPPDKTPSNPFVEAFGRLLGKSGKST